MKESTNRLATIVISRLEVPDSESLPWLLGSALLGLFFSFWWSSNPSPATKLVGPFHVRMSETSAWHAKHQLGWNSQLSIDHISQHFPSSLSAKVPSQLDAFLLRLLGTSFRHFWRFHHTNLQRYFSFHIFSHHWLVQRNRVFGWSSWSYDVDSHPSRSYIAQQQIASLTFCMLFCNNPMARLIFILCYIFSTVWMLWTTGVVFFSRSKNRPDGTDGPLSGASSSKSAVPKRFGGNRFVEDWISGPKGLPQLTILQADISSAVMFFQIGGGRGPVV